MTWVDWPWAGSGLQCSDSLDGAGLGSSEHAVFAASSTADMTNCAVAAGPDANMATGGSGATTDQGVDRAPATGGNAAGASPAGGSGGTPRIAGLRVPTGSVASPCRVGCSSAAGVCHRYGSSQLTLRLFRVVVGVELLCLLAGGEASLLPCAVASPGVTSRGPSAGVWVERQKSALGCPDGNTLTARIESILRRPLSREVSTSHSIRVYVRFRRVAGAYVADLEFRGKKEGVRVLSDRSPLCEPLADAVSVAIALVLDRELEQAARSASNESLPASKRASKAPEAAQPAESSPKRHGQPATDAGLQLRLTAGGGVATGFADSVSPLLAAELAVPVSDWAFAASFGSVMASGTKFSGGEVETSLLMGSLGACRVFGERVGLGPCAFVGMGRLRGQGVGYDEDRTRDMLWTAVGAGIVAEGLVWGPLLVEMTANLWLAPRRQSYSVENAGPAWQSPRLSGWMTCRVGLWFR